MKNPQDKDNQIKNLLELNDELENYFRNTIIPQLFVDADLILRKSTPPAMTLFKFAAEDIGKPLDELIDKIQYSGILENIQDVIETGDIFEKEIETSNLRWYQLNIIPYIIQKTNKPNGVIITLIDITDRIKDLKDLEKLNTVHETFIYSVSHDLKAPLSNIEALAKTLTEITNNEDKNNGQNDIIKMINESTETMRGIVDELSEITKIKGNYQEKTETLNFNTIIKEVELTIKDQINKSNATINLELNVEEIEISRKSLRSIIYNLLSNSIKYKSPDRNPEVLLKTEKEKDFIKISVKDNGLGISEDNKELIFSKFTRIRTNVSGSGIGLYLVKKIVENEKGKIVVNSKLDQGSEFIVYLKYNT